MKDKLILIIIAIFTSVSCSKNFLNEIADKRSDQARYHDALKKLNNSDYSGAIASCQLMSPAFAAKRENRFVCASAYAGRCGFTTLDLVEDIMAWDASSLLFEFLLTMYPAATQLQSDDCHMAETLIRQSGDAPDRTSDENLMLVLMGLTKIGVISNLTADLDDDTNVDPGFDACDVADLSDQEAYRAGSGFWELLNSFNYIGLDLFSGAGAFDITDICLALDALDPDINFCNATSPEDFTVDHLRGVRTLLNEDNLLGLGMCTNGPTCLCL